MAAPYSGTPIALPATLEAENFDKGGEGVGYHDLTASNTGGQYRSGEAVDIIASSDSAGGGYVVNNFQTGEWLAYTVNAPASGSYNLALRVSSNYFSPTAFHIEVDGTNVTGSVTVPKTGSWSTFQWVAAPAINLSGGQHTIRVVADAAYFNLNQIRIQTGTLSSPTPTPGAGSYSGTPYTGTPIPLPRMFEAEDFDKGGQGIAYSDKTASNVGGQYRPSEGVDIIASADSAGGRYVVNYFQTGEWMAYTVNVPTSGKYDLSIRASSNYSSTPAFHFEVDGVNVTGSIAVPKTGGWSTFQWVGKAGVDLAAGKHVLKLVADAEYFNVNQISVLASAATPTTGTGGTGTGGTATGGTGSGGTTTPTEPGAISGKGYHLVKNWDFVNGIRSVTALQSEFYPFYVYSNGTLNFLGQEWQRYRDFTNGNHVFTGEGLALRALLRSGQSLAAGNIDSGMLRSKWTGKYGYYEVRMKVPGGLGLWPAFWLNPQDQGWPPEIDILEIVNNGRDTTANSFHYVHGAGEKPATFSLLDQWGSYRPGFDYKNDFHTFAVEWTPTVVRHYVDDKLVVERPYTWMHDNGSDGGPAHVLLNLAVGGSWPGAPTASSLPADLVVKYMRVWQK